LSFIYAVKYNVQARPRTVAEASHRALESFIPRNLREDKGKFGAKLATGYWLLVAGYKMHSP
jgi:hypothetical protein